MKKFTQIKEELENKKFYKTKAEVTLQVEAASEGEAGYLFDSILGGIAEQVDHNVINIEEVEKSLFEEYRAINVERETDVDTSTIDDYIRAHMKDRSVSQLFDELKGKEYSPIEIGNRLAIFFDQREF